MKKYTIPGGCILAMLCCCGVQGSQAQSVSISDDGRPADPSAMLEVRVTGHPKKGFLMPRLTTGQRFSIVSPAKGLMVYDSTGNYIYYYNGTAWMPLSTGAPSSWAIYTTDIYNNNTGNVGIGLSRPKAKLHVAPNKTVVFGGDSLSSAAGAQWVWFATKGALRFREPKNPGIYPEPLPYNYAAIGNNSLAIGECVAGHYSLAIGNAANASGSNSLAQGFGAYAGGAGSLARGLYATATGESSYSSGANSQALGAYSFTHGEWLISDAAYCVAIGKYNDPLTGNSPVNWVPRDPLFLIGNGGDGVPSNAMAVLKNGVVSIGLNPVPDQPSWGLLQVRSREGKDHLTLVQQHSTNRWGAAIPDTGTPDLFLRFNGVNKGKFSSANGAYVQVSDLRLKKDLLPIASVLSGMLQLKAYSYRYTDNDGSAPVSHGFLAQEVAKTFPALVSRVSPEDAEELLGIDYSGLIVIAVKAIQEQQEIIRTQQQQIDELAKRLDALEQKER